MNSHRFSPTAAGQLSLFPKPKPLVDRNSSLQRYDFSLLKPKGYDLRPYQEDATAYSISEGNAIIVLGTGTGKTEIGFHIAAEALQRGKVLLIADTVILSKQHHRDALASFNLEEEEIVLAVGDNIQRRKDPVGFYKNARLVIGTPETVIRDIRKGLLSMHDFSLVIFDEVHHTRGLDDYANVANAAISASVPRVGFSASPADTRADLQLLIDVLQIEGGAMYVGKDEEVEKYVAKPAYIKYTVELEEERHRALGLLKELAEGFFKEIVASAKGVWFKELLEHYSKTIEKFELPTMKEMNAGKEMIDRKVAAAKRENFVEGKTYFRINSYHAAMYKLIYHYHVLERIGSREFEACAQKLGRERTKAAKMIVESRQYRECRRISSALQDHPKMDAVLELLGKSGGQALVFVETQEHARRLARFLNDKGIPSHELVGRKGMTSRKQVEVRKMLEDGELQVVVATSVANEGLHLPSVKLAINYSAPQSAISDQQRSGRVRDMNGKVFTLVGLGTTDETLFAIAQSKKRSLKQAYAEFSSPTEKQEPVQGDLLS